MKNSFILFAGVFLVSCGGNNPQKDANTVCECFEKANDMPADAPGRITEQDECMKLQQESWDKYKDNAEDGKIFNAVIAECSQKMIEKSLQQTAE